MSYNWKHDTRTLRTSFSDKVEFLWMKKKWESIINFLFYKIHSFIHSFPSNTVRNMGELTLDGMPVHGRAPIWVNLAYPIHPPACFWTVGWKQGNRRKAIDTLSIRIKNSLSSWWSPGPWSCEVEVLSLHQHTALVSIISLNKNRNIYFHNWE